MSYPPLPTMNRCWTTTTNPTERNEEPHNPSQQQAEGPLAKDLTRHPTHLNRPPRRPGHSPQTLRQRDATTSFVHTLKQKPL